MSGLISSVSENFEQWLTAFTSGRWIITVLVGIGLAVLFNLFISRIVLRIIKFATQRVDATNDAEKLIRWRRLETSLSVVLAVAKLTLGGVALYLAWRLVNPNSTPIAVVGASAFFVVLAGATVGPLLRDLTYGIIMIAERWYNVGDFVTVEPFLNVSGVVEQVTLRATKLRSLNGEVVWIHNQHIQAVRILPRGARSLSLEVFVSDATKGKKLLEQALTTVPTGPTMVNKKFKVTECEKFSDSLWRIAAHGQTLPGREWLIEDFAVKAIKKLDESSKHPVIVQGPIVLNADDAANRRFKRSIRAKTSLTS